MKNCNCNLNAAPGVVPGPTPFNVARGCKPTIYLRTVVIPANAGTDAEGMPYAPKPGAEHNAIVHYLANGAIYVYDSNGVFTQFTASSLDTLETEIEQLGVEVEQLETALHLLNHPADVVATVNTYADLATLVPSAYPNESLVEVKSDETHQGNTTLYVYSATAGSWVYYGDVAPYATQEVVDTLQTNLTTVADNLETLQSNVNTDVTNLTEAVNALENQEFKTINGQSIKGEGNIEIEGGGGGGEDTRLTDEGATHANNLPMTITDVDQIHADASSISLATTTTNLDTGSVTYPNLTFPIATPSTAGGMSATDKTKLDGLGSTVLFTGDGTLLDTITLSEAATNFEYIKIFGYEAVGSNILGTTTSNSVPIIAEWSQYCIHQGRTSYVPVAYNIIAANGTKQSMECVMWAFNNAYTELTFTGYGTSTISSTNTSVDQGSGSTVKSPMFITKVIGYNRTTVA